MITTTIMIVIGLLVGSTQKKFMVQAQLFVNCADIELDGGGTVEGCIYNAASPLTVSLTDGSSVTFGTESGIFVYCNPSVARSVDTCVCSVIVDPTDPATASDFCDSCTITAISDTEFDPYFDCSNRLVGDCVGIDSAGLCIDNNVGTAPAPVRVPISAPLGNAVPSPTPLPVSAPIAAPTPFLVTVATFAPLLPPTPFPVTVATLAPLPPPTPFPITIVTSAPLTPQSDLPPSTAPTAREAFEMPSKPAGQSPINTSTTSTSGQDVGSGTLIIGSAIGCVGGLFLAALIALLILIVQRKKSASTSNEAKETATFSNQRNESNFDDEFIHPWSSRTTLGVSDITGAVASLVRPPAIYPPLFYPMSDTTSNTTYTTEILEPKKCDAIHPYPVNPLLHVKDQCREVALVRVPAPILSSESVRNITNIPVVVPMGVVNMVASAETPVPVSSESIHHSYDTC